MKKEIKIEDRSEKAQEKFADHLMSMSGTIITATTIGVLVVPLGAFINSYIAPNTQPFSWNALYSGLKNFNVIVFGILYFAPLATAMYARSTALDIYDRLHYKSNKKANPSIKRDALKRAPYVKR